MKFAFEARGFLLNVGLQTATLLEQENEAAFPTIRGLAYDAIPVRMGDFTSSDITPDSTLEKVFYQERERIKVTADVIKEAIGARLHNAGVLRYLTAG
jgi:hypothetical protein